VSVLSTAFNDECNVKYTNNHTSIAATLTGQRSERADSRLLVAEVTGLPITKDTHRLKMYTAQWISLCDSPSAELMTKTTKMTLTVIAIDG